MVIDGSGRPVAEPSQSQRELAGLPRSPRRRVRLNAVAFGVVLWLAFVIQGLVRNQAFEWRTVRSYLFDPFVLEGLRRTLELTALSMALAILVGVILALMRMSSSVTVRAVSAAYVWFFRSVPLLVLLIFSYNFSVIYTKLSVGVPFGPQWWQVSTVQTLNAFWAAVLAFGLQQAAYTAEVIRAALSAVPQTQRDAAKSLAMTPFHAFRHIVLPQAMRIALLPLCNDTINVLKGTAIVAFISVPDLLYSVQQIYDRTFQVVPLLTVAAFWYMALVSALSIGQYALERRLGIGPAVRVGGRTVPPLASKAVGETT
jgi:polar amino acid transport system permease protein